LSKKKGENSDKQSDKREMKHALLYRRFATQTAARVAAQQYNRNRAYLAAGLVVGAYALNKKSVQAKSAEEPAENPAEKQKFKTRKLREYENKIRMYSNPDRIFRYFATVATVYPDGKREDIYMTPDDFVRSLTIDGELQPEDCLIDKFRSVKTAERGSKMTAKELAKIGDTFAAFGGYINQEDYMFLLTVLTTPKRNFEIAFRMFDLDGNGVVDAQEFDKVIEIIMKGTPVAKKHTNRRKQSNIARYFFGDDRKNELTSDEFLKFQTDIQREILKIEFDKLKPDANNTITYEAFANMILLNSGFDKEKRGKVRKRIRKYFKKKRKQFNKKAKKEAELNGTEPEEFVQPRCSFAECSLFFEFISNIHDVDTAFAFYAMSGKEVDSKTMHSVAKTVCGIDLSQNTIEMIFTIFDDDDSKTLNRSEFVDVMKARLERGLKNKRDFGFTNKLGAIFSCGCETYIPSVYKMFVEMEEHLGSSLK